ncbi:protein HGH1 homolog [Pecten maximus]|uniref:protein HGH1 homolog n=1 Tax=Pecten maximus TaxID=6579 RepID=UPI00145913D7|nr:protein HGH1 homolog [Pecten maximus]XP_033747924.1 protein HGH1 homolog [Pecten maximus]
MEGLDKEHLEKEFGPFLNPEAKLDVKGIAIEYFLGLSGGKEGCLFVGASDKFLEGIVSLLKDDKKDIVEKSYQTLINLTNLETTSKRLLSLPSYPNLAAECVKEMLDPEFEMADYVCKLLSNVTRTEDCAKIVAKVVIYTDQGIPNLVNALCSTKHNSKANLHHLATVLGNLTQIREVRTKVMAKDQFVVQRLLPFIEFKESKTRRHGIIACLKNCCFDVDCHEWLLSDSVDLLPRLLLPLAGPEEFDDEDNDKLPDDLQYLPPDKTRESDPEIRRMLIETIFKLCATKNGRAFVKEKNTYIIMREYHKWEEHEANFHALMNLIDMLISDEPQPGMENLDTVEIPQDVKEKFLKMDKQREEMETSDQT